MDSGAAIVCFFFFNDTATTEIYTLSYTTLFRSRSLILGTNKAPAPNGALVVFGLDGKVRQTLAGIDRPNNVDVESSEEHTSGLQSQANTVCRPLLETNNDFLEAVARIIWRALRC